MKDSDNGQKEPNVLFDRATFEDDDYIYPQGIDNIKLLMTPGGDDPLNLYMRADLKNDAVAMAFAISDERCAEHDDMGGKRKLLKMIASSIGVQGKRANLVSDTLIGERRANAMRRGWSDRLRDAAGLGGDKE